jgi:uncharacterized radical SAM protein YgiQ
MEASMRRVAHYDYWEDKLKPSIMADAKADVLVYGMGERAVREITRRLRRAIGLQRIRGTTLFLGSKATAAADFTDCIILPSWEELQADKTKHLMRLTKVVEAQQTPYCGKRLVQMHGNRALFMEPPAIPVDGPELDALYEYPFMRLAHPSYKLPVPGFATIKDSIIVSRGCPGGCTFCGLGFHQGKFLSSRSVDSVLKEVRRWRNPTRFRGTISDLGGPTANLYAAQNGHADACKKCHRPSCLWPTICPHFGSTSSGTRSPARRAPATRGEARVRAVRHPYGCGVADAGVHEGIGSEPCVRVT